MVSMTNATNLMQANFSVLEMQNNQAFLNPPQTTPVKGIEKTQDKAEDALSSAMERLATGLRINGAEDDAAGLQIAERLAADITGNKAAGYNINYGSSMLQTADGAMAELESIALRQTELAVQAGNGLYSDADRAALDQEYQALNDEMNRILENTEFAGQKVFGELNDTKLQIGNTTKDTVDVSFDKPDNSGLVSGSLLSPESSQNVMEQLDQFMDNLGGSRAEIGGSLNQLEHASSNLTGQQEELEQAHGFITDADMAQTMSEQTSAEIAQSVSGAMSERTYPTREQVVGILA